jgi:hypothetical protein
MLPTPREPARQTLSPRDEIVLPTRGRPLKSSYVLPLVALIRGFKVLVLLLVLCGAIAVLVDQSSLRDDLLANASSLHVVARRCTSSSAVRPSVSSKACSPAAQVRCG